MKQEVFGDISVYGTSVIHGLILAAGGEITVPRNVFEGATETSLFVKQDFDTGAITYKVIKGAITNDAVISAHTKGYYVGN